MPRLSDYKLLYQNEQPVLVISHKTNLENLAAVIKQSKEKIKKYLDGLGEYLTDIAFVDYYNGDLGNLDIDICFPTRKALHGKGEIKYATMPANKIVMCMLRGGHEERKKLYAQTSRWIEDNGYEYAGNTYEYFYSDTDTLYDEVLVKVVMTVKDKKDKGK